MDLAKRMLVARARAATRRAARERHQQLVRELGSYSTVEQRDDFAATLDRYPDGVTHELRGILNRTPASRSFSAIGRP